MTMFPRAEFIVGLWFLPVTLFIIIPLVMKIVWHAVMAANVLINREGKNHDEQIQG